MDADGTEWCTPCGQWGQPRVKVIFIDICVCVCFFFKFFVVYSSDIGSMIAIIGDSFASRGDIWPISIRLPGDVAWSQAAGEYIHIYIYIYIYIAESELDICIHVEHVHAST